jgi:hypothetical protein
MSERLFPRNTNGNKKKPEFFSVTGRTQTEDAKEKWDICKGRRKGQVIFQNDVVQR